MEGLNLEGVHGLAACVEEGSCCSLEADRLGPSWVVGRRKEEVGVQEVVLREVDRHDMGVLAGHSWAALGRRWEPLSSSWTAGSGSPPRT